MRKRKTSGVIVCVILILVAFAGGFILGRNNPGFLRRTDPKLVQEEIEESLSAIGEFATYQYRYTNTASQENNLKIEGWDIPLTKKYFVIRYDGIIKAGIKVSDIKIVVNDRTIIVDLPYSTILSHEIDEHSLEVLDETKNIFNPIQIEDYNTFQIAQKSLCERTALKKGLLTLADDNARAVVRALIERLDITDGYKVQYE